MTSVSFDCPGTTPARGYQILLLSLLTRHRPLTDILYVCEVINSRTSVTKKLNLPEEVFSHPTDHLFLTCPSEFIGCVDGVVGVAARVASVQLPWLTSEVEPSPDLTNHITGLETMMSEMQQRVRGSI